MSKEEKHECRCEQEEVNSGLILSSLPFVFLRFGSASVTAQLTKKERGEQSGRAPPTICSLSFAAFDGQGSSYRAALSLMH